MFPHSPVLNCKPPIGLHGKYVFTQCVSKAYLSGWVNSTTTLFCTMLSLASLTHVFHKCFSQSFPFKSKLFGGHPCSYDILQVKVLYRFLVVKVVSLSLASVCSFMGMFYEAMLG